MGKRNKGITKSQGRKHTLDKFYTRLSVAKQCISLLGDMESYSLIIEPSAGAGAFSNLIDGCLALDISPESDNIIEQDWFTYERAREAGSSILVIGNPPFGVRGNLAIDFINHSAKFADRIAFLLPLSFMKENLQEKLDPHLHLNSSLVLPENSFLLKGEIYNVPSVFQIWDYKDSVREKPKTLKPLGFRFVRKSDSPDISVQRIGSNAGKVSVNISDRSEQSHYFIQSTYLSITALVEALNSLEHPHRDYSVGPRSISQRELLKELSEKHPKLVHVS